VERRAAIAAEGSTVFALVNDFHRWNDWSPWAKIDPFMKQSYEGPESGQGAKYSWAGNDDVGEGKMTILESQAGQKIAIRLEFVKPFASTSLTSFVFRPDGRSTEVEWSMEGDNDFMGKVFSLVAGGMDKAIGPDFEKGLAQMKALAEKTAAR
jgi:hypothetical protein